MMQTDELSPAMDIRDAIGQLADGVSIDPIMVPLVRAAVSGTCSTADRGEQQFVIDVGGCGLLNVDTEELIWPQSPEHTCEGDDVPLRILTDHELWARTRDRWDGQRPREWTAFVWRVAVPLSNRLGLVRTGW